MSIQVDSLYYKRREEGKKLSVLTRESIIFQKEINKINDIAIFLKEMDNNSPDLIKFMQCYKDHFETAEKCFVKEIKSTINDLNQGILHLMSMIYQEN